MSKRKILHFVVLSLITLLLTINWTSVVLGQFPIAIPSGNTSIRTETPWWDPNKAQRCGRLWCSEVHLFGGLDKTFRVAVAPDALENPSDAPFEVEKRAKQVESIYNSIYDRVRKSELMFQGNIVQSPFGAIANWQNLFFNRDNLGKHPATPKIEIGIRNNQTVVFVPRQLELGLSAQTIVTINRADSLYQGKLIEDIAKEWRFLIFESLNEALWAYEIDYHYPFARFGVAIAILLIVAIPVTILAVIKQLLKVWNRHLSGQLRVLKESLTVDAEALSSDELASSDTIDQNKENIQVNRQKVKLNRGIIISTFKKVIDRPDKALAKAKLLLEDAVQNISQNLPNLSLKKQSIIKRQKNILELFLGLLFWIQLFLILLALTLIILIFPETRRYTYFFLGQSIAIPLIWMFANIADKLSNIFIDFYLNKWAKNAQISNPNSNRYILRVSTYSNALRSGTSFLFITAATVTTVLFLGINLTVLASAGGVAFVVAFLSRNVVEDMLNGILILWTDRYAIGDVIQIGTIGGFVENMNIYITQIRGSEGRLVTIPNSKISIVENLTKDWSRVEFKIEIAYDADVRKALNVINEVSEEIQNDPTWKDKIIEPASILGVDNISHQGVLIQVWIKTQAMQQWAVGREFRLRIKEAFELAEIPIGVPHQEVKYQTSLSNENQ
ncbi:mechanosensitive ion channel family protein [Crocosphaera sp. Alani8]|uniref:mechanosensitive ion channel family protein n=1 Tax=Crocosphaera sp. Alani8 TaxID=3038952 RepID=UPI00313B2D37